MIADLQTALTRLRKTHARVVILTEAGKAFCAGTDLALLQAIATNLPPKIRTIPAAWLRCSAAFGATKSPSSPP
jgi:enoyl-CoA hydratase/carnithine racemase